MLTWQDLDPAGDEPLHTPDMEIILDQQLCMEPFSNCDPGLYKIEAGRASWEFGSMHLSYSASWLGMQCYQLPQAPVISLPT